MEYFEKAIEKDPNYAIAYAGMADAFVAVERNMGSQVTPWGPTLLPRAKAAAERAVELDPMLSEAQSAMASIRAREYAWQDADRGFRRAIELNPNNALAHLERGTILVVQERFGEGLDEVGRALALDPLSPYVNTEVGGALLLAGRYAESVEQLRKASALDPSRNRPNNMLGRALDLQGKPAEALTTFHESIKRGAILAGVEWMACAEVRAGRREEALVLLQEQLSRPHRTRLVASTYACLGDEEHALEYLEKSLAENEPGLAELLQAPELASMRTNPRFTALRRKLNLPS